VQAELAAELPHGATEADALAFLSRHGYAMDQEVKPLADTYNYLGTHGVPAGTLVLYGRVYPSGRWWFGDYAIDIWILFDDTGRVERTYVRG
jgi:hypothetical protein